MLLCKTNNKDFLENSWNRASICLLPQMSQSSITNALRNEVGSAHWGKNSRINCFEESLWTDPQNKNMPNWDGSMCPLNTIATTAFEGQLVCLNSSKPLAERTNTCIFNIPRLDHSHPGQHFCLPENSLWSYYGILFKNIISAQREASEWIKNIL